MPTHKETDRFWRDYDQLTDAEARAYLQAVSDFVTDLRRGRFRASLHVHSLGGHPGVFSMAWGGDGRATFQYGQQVHTGDVHIIWRRVGGHEIYQEP